MEVVDTHSCGLLKLWRMKVVEMKLWRIQVVEMKTCGVENESCGCVSRVVETWFFRLGEGSC